MNERIRLTLSPQAVLSYRQRTRRESYRLMTRQMSLLSFPLRKSWSRESWTAAVREGKNPAAKPRSSLITDSNAYADEWQ